MCEGARGHLHLIVDANSLQLLDKATKGTYQHYFPGAGRKLTLGSVAPAKRGNN